MARVGNIYCGDLCVFGYIWIPPAWYREPIIQSP